MNYYMLLEIKSDASQNEIKKAYRKMAQKYHPDHFGKDASPFLKIQEAYQILSDPVKRHKYDRTLSQPPSGETLFQRKTKERYGSEPEPLIPGKSFIREKPISLSHSFTTFSPSFEEMFDRLFNQFHSNYVRKSDRKENLKVEITLRHEEALAGGSFQLMVPVRKFCPLCSGTGTVGIWDCQRCLSAGFIDTEIRNVFIS